MKILQSFSLHWTNIWICSVSFYLHKQLIEITVFHCIWIKHVFAVFHSIYIYNYLLSQCFIATTSKAYLQCFIASASKAYLQCWCHHVWVAAYAKQCFMNIIPAFTNNSFLEQYVTYTWHDYLDIQEIRLQIKIISVLINFYLFWCLLMMLSFETTDFDGCLLLLEAGRQMYCIL